MPDIMISRSNSQREFTDTEGKTAALKQQDDGRRFLIGLQILFIYFSICWPFARATLNAAWEFRIPPASSVSMISPVTLNAPNEINPKSTSKITQGGISSADR